MNAGDAAKPPDGFGTRSASISNILIGVVAALGLLYVLRGIVAPLFLALLLMALIDAIVRGLRRL